MTILWEQRATLQALFVIALAAAAYLRGASPERWTAGTLLGMQIAAWAFELWVHQGAEAMTIAYGTIQPFYIVTDIAAFLILSAVALKANRFYPIPMAGFQLVSVITHFATGLVSARYPLAYALMNALPYYCMIVAMFVGLLAHIRRHRRIGLYASWRTP